MHIPYAITTFEFSLIKQADGFARYSMYADLLPVLQVKEGKTVLEAHWMGIAAVRIEDAHGALTWQTTPESIQSPPDWQHKNSVELLRPGLPSSEAKPPSKPDNAPLWWTSWRERLQSQKEKAKDKELWLPSQDDSHILVWDFGQALPASRETRVQVYDAVGAHNEIEIIWYRLPQTRYEITFMARHTPVPRSKPNAFLTANINTTAVARQLATMQWLNALDKFLPTHYECAFSLTFQVTLALAASAPFVARQFGEAFLDLLTDAAAEHDLPPLQLLVQSSEVGIEEKFLVTSAVDSRFWSQDASPEAMKPTTFRVLPSISLLDFKP